MQEAGLNAPQLSIDACTHTERTRACILVVDDKLFKREFAISVKVGESKLISNRRQNFSRSSVWVQKSEQAGELMLLDRAVPVAVAGTELGLP